MRLYREMKFIVIATVIVIVVAIVIVIAIAIVIVIAIAMSWWRLPQNYVLMAPCKLHSSRGHSRA